MHKSKRVKVLAVICVLIAILGGILLHFCYKNSKERIADNNSSKYVEIIDSTYILIKAIEQNENSGIIIDDDLKKKLKDSVGIINKNDYQPKYLDQMLKYAYCLDYLDVTKMISLDKKIEECYDSKNQAYYSVSPDRLQRKDMLVQEVNFTLSYSELLKWSNKYLTDKIDVDKRNIDWFNKYTSDIDSLNDPEMEDVILTSFWNIYYSDKVNEIDYMCIEPIYRKYIEEAKLELNKGENSTELVFSATLLDEVNSLFYNDKSYKNLDNKIYSELKKDELFCGKWNDSSELEILMSDLEGVDDLNLNKSYALNINTWLKNYYIKFIK